MWHEWTNIYIYKHYNNADMKNLGAFHLYMQVGSV